MNQEQEQNVEQMTPLDQMIAQDQLQMLKAAIPYASFGLQPSLAILSKWLELQRTIQLFSRPADLSMMSVDAPHVSPLEMLQDISRFAAGPPCSKKAAPAGRSVPAAARGSGCGPARRRCR